MFVSDSFHFSHGCLRQTGVLASASPAHCGRAYKVVQSASREASVPELPVGPATHRLVCCTPPSSPFPHRLRCTAPAPACLLCSLPRRAAASVCVYFFFLGYLGLHSSTFSPGVDFLVWATSTRPPANVNTPSRLFCSLYEARCLI